MHQPFADSIDIALTVAPQTEATEEIVVERPQPRTWTAPRAAQPTEVSADTLAADSLAIDSLGLQPMDSLRADTMLSAVVQPTGLPCEPPPYVLRNDSGLSIALLLGLLLFLTVFSRSLGAVALQAKNLFRNRDRSQAFSLKSESEMYGGVLVTALASFLLAALYFRYREPQLPHTITATTANLLLLANVGIFLTYYLVKGVLYRLVNWTFFSAARRTQWNNIYMLALLLRTALFFVLALSYIYLDLSSAIVNHVIIIGVASTQMLLLFKSAQIFFVYRFGYVQLFMYFCSLELGPVVVLWQLLAFLNDKLIEII